VTGGPGSPDEAGAERTGVPLGFTVPEGWSPADPAVVGEPGAAFAAVRNGPAEPVEPPPNIVVSVWRRADGPSVDDLADEAIGRAALAADELRVLRRLDLGDPHAPGATQSLEVRTGAGRELTRTEVHLAIPLADSPADLLAVELSCTCPPEQTAAVAPAFQEFVASFHLRTGGSGSADRGGRP
jgi:hypothetical protein